MFSRRRIITALVTSVVATVGTLGATASPAAASAPIPGCIAAGPWGLIDSSDSSLGRASISVYVNHVCDADLGPILEAVVDDEGSYYSITVHDYKSDGVGMVFHLHLTGGSTYSLNSLPAAGPAAHANLSKSSIAAPLNFWVRIHAEVNSPAVNLP